MQNMAIIALLLASALFTCTSDTNPPYDNTVIPISDQTIIGNWIGENTKSITCLNASGNREKGTAIIECQYTLYKDSITFSRNKIVRTSCIGAIEDDDLPSRPDPYFIKSFWKLLNDSLYIYNERLKQGVYDTSLIELIKLLPFSSNKIIFKTDAYSDTCQKH
jgi:hypothetical protein